jgi:hypothetical protein
MQSDKIVIVYTRYGNYTKFIRVAGRLILYCLQEKALPIHVSKIEN